jgi:hypothetical protein
MLNAGHKQRFEIVCKQFAIKRLALLDKIYRGATKGAVNTAVRENTRCKDITFKLV